MCGNSMLSHYLSCAEVCSPEWCRCAKSGPLFCALATAPVQHTAPACGSFQATVLPVCNCAACLQLTSKQLCCLCATSKQLCCLCATYFQATVLPVCNLLPSNCAACVQLLSKQLCCLCATSKQLCCLCATVYLSEQAGPNQHSHDGPTRLHAPQVVCLAFKYLL